MLKSKINIALRSPSENVLSFCVNILMSGIIKNKTVNYHECLYFVVYCYFDSLFLIKQITIFAALFATSESWVCPY